MSLHREYYDWLKFPEHAFGLPAIVTRLTHYYGPGHTYGWKKLGVGSQYGDKPPYLYSRDIRDYYWIISKPLEDVERDINTHPNLYPEEMKEAVRRRVEQLDLLAQADRNDDRPSSSPELAPAVCGNDGARPPTSAATQYVNAHLRRSENLWEPLPAGSEPEPREIHSNPTLTQSPSPELVPAVPNGDEASSLPKLALVVPHSDEQSPPPRTPKRVYELPLRFHGSGVAKQPLPEPIPSLNDICTVTSPLRSWKEADGVQVGRLDTRVALKPPSPEPTPSPSDKSASSPPLEACEADESRSSTPDTDAVAQISRPEPKRSTNDSAAASPPQSQLKEPAKSPIRSGASALAQPRVPKSVPLIRDVTAADSLPTPPEEEEAGFTIVTRRHRLNANPDARIKAHVDTYQIQQKVFERALARSPVSEGDREEFVNLFKWDTDGQLVEIKTNQIKRAATIARGSPAWTSESSHELMHALWVTILRRKAAGPWYARLNVKDKRVADDASHRHFIVVLEAAWRIFNDGDVFDPESPPTRAARQGAA